MYNPVERREIAETLVHLRGLFRQTRPATKRELLAHERREVVTKNLLSNLTRTKDHPTLHTVLELAEIFSLTLDGAHRLFGYDLGRMREYDFRLNAGRTHILESYSFRRDLQVDLPSQFAEGPVFDRNALLQDLIPSWQTNVPIRALEEEGWHKPGAFYVHVGTEDSLGSSLPPGATALVEPIDEEERRRPNPRAIYLLQFGNGYRCSRCVVTQGRLILLVTARAYTGPQEFRYPANVRIAGRIRMFALRLPVPDYPSLHTLPSSPHNAPLVLPWEHTSLDQLFTAKHLRFRRSKQEHLLLQETLELIFQTRLSGRTERRYRHLTRSQPHIHALLQLTLMNVARYTDALRASRSLPSDLGRFSLETLLRTKSFEDLPSPGRRPSEPSPVGIWEDRRREFGEWPPLLSTQFPQLGPWQDKVLRVSDDNSIPGLTPPLARGSLMILENPTSLPDPSTDARKLGWTRPIYAFRRGKDLLCGHLEREGVRFKLLLHTSESGSHFTFGLEDLPQLSLVSGVAVPV